MYFLGCAGSETSADVVQVAEAHDRFRPELNHKALPKSVGGNSTVTLKNAQRNPHRMFADLQGHRRDHDGKHHG